MVNTIVSEPAAAARTILFPLILFVLSPCRDYNGRPLTRVSVTDWTSYELTSVNKR